MMIFSRDPFPFFLVGRGVVSIGQGGQEEEADSGAPAEVAGGDDGGIEGEVEEGGRDEEEASDVFEEAEDAAEDAAAAAAAAVGEAEAEGESAGGGSAGGFFKPGLFKKRAKTGNKLCSWSWKEQRCEPADLCKYKYQASRFFVCICVCVFFLLLIVVARWWLLCRVSGAFGWCCWRLLCLFAGHNGKSASLLLSLIEESYVFRP